MGDETIKIKIMDSAKEAIKGLKEAKNLMDRYKNLYDDFKILYAEFHGEQATEELYLHKGMEGQIQALWEDIRLELRNQKSLIGSYNRVCKEEHKIDIEFLYEYNG